MYETDVLEHKMFVQLTFRKIINELLLRGRTHDNSKLKSPEKELYAQYNEELKRAPYGSDQYRSIVDKLRPAIMHHYEENDHHPEHFENGIFDMNIFQITDMLVDWYAVAHAKGTDLVEDLPKLMQNHGIPENYYMIFKNTIERIKELK